MNDPVGLADHLRDLYLKYLDSAQPIRDARLMDERRRLLEKPGVLSQPPRIEPVPRYAETEPLADACHALGLSAEFADFAARGLFRPSRKLYEHQRAALQDVAVEGRSLVVTTGTGSGKTECFLLPIFEALVRESARWTGPDRPRAVRALILYPLNALVEDQMIRLRQAADSVEVPDGSGARRWLAENRSDRFTFGRYTGSTPVSGHPKSKTKRAERSKWQRKLKDQAMKVHDNLELRYQFPSLDDDAGECWDRWTMQATPPDILVTNYSMLNIMLMRAIEERIFDQTAAWLRQDRRHVFHLVVDELHSYRGTQGTEVAYLLRLLLRRLGLTPDSPQLRFLASSASLEVDRAGLAYLEGFFGLPGSAFSVRGGQPPEATPSPPLPLAGTASSFLSFRSDWGTNPAEAVARLAGGLGVAITPTGAPAATLGVVLKAAKVPEAVREGYERPERPDQLGRRVFGEGTDREAVAGLLQALAVARDGPGRDDSAPLPLRAHLFFRNVPGLWACCDRRCNQVDPAGRAGNEPRAVGRLFAAPRLACDCGARVLDILVCQCCGEVYLGGFRRHVGSPFELVHDQPDLERVPSPVLQPKRNGQYAVFWPSDEDPMDIVWDQSPRRRRWTRASLDVATGQLTTGGDVEKAEAFNGWVYEIVGVTDDDAIKFPALPSKCARCDTDWSRVGQTPGQPVDPSKAATPLMAHRTGFQKVNQVLADGLLRRIDEPKSRKLVVFTDSRQDAAKLSAGIELDHYRDLVRQALLRSFDRLGSDLAAYLKFVDAGHRPDSLGPDEIEAFKRYRSNVKSPSALTRSRRSSGIEATSSREPMRFPTSPTALPPRRLGSWPSRPAARPPGHSPCRLSTTRSGRRCWSMAATPPAPDPAPDDGRPASTTMQP
jgi:DEAD/DEAH box helicase domain-containing protein